VGGVPAALFRGTAFAYTKEDDMSQREEYPVTSFRAPRGFTLLELMAVLAVIAILAAITVPKLYGVNDRNRLIEMTGDIESVAAHVRALAMKTSRAAVMEFSGNHIWINRLEGAACTADFAERCVQNMGIDKDADGTNVLEVDEPIYLSAGVTICDVRVATQQADGTCLSTLPIAPGDDFAFCYAGNGELWIRRTADTAAVCTGSGSPANAAWEKACVPWAGVAAPTAAQQFSGAVIRLNRFTGAAGACPLGSDATGDVLDVARAVHLPAGGHPFSKVEP